jgi:hypothetical protein
MMTRPATSWNGSSRVCRAQLGQRADGLDHVVAHHGLRRAATNGAAGVVGDDRSAVDDHAGDSFLRGGEQVGVAALRARSRMRVISGLIRVRSGVQRLLEDLAVGVAHQVS